MTNASVEEERASLGATAPKGGAARTDHPGDFTAWWDQAADCGSEGETTSFMEARGICSTANSQSDFPVSATPASRFSGKPPLSRNIRVISLWDWTPLACRYVPVTNCLPH